MSPAASPPARHALGTRPKPDESLVSFIFRLAQRRGTPTGSMLAAQAGSTNMRSRPSKEFLSRLAAIADIDVTELRAISYGSWNSTSALFRGVPIHTTLLKGHVAARRVCPKCLTEAPYHRAVWDLSFSSACPTHRGELIDACLNCGNWLGWRGNDLTRCGCSRGDLTRMSAVPVAPELLDGLAVAYGLLGDERFVEDARGALSLIPMRDLGPVDALEFIFRLGMDLVSGPRRKMFSLEHPGELDQPTHVALHLGLASARDWPDAFLGAPAVIARNRVPWSATHWWKWRAAVRRWLDRMPSGRGMAIRQAMDVLVATGAGRPVHPGENH